MSKIEYFISAPTKKLQVWLRRWEPQIIGALFGGQARATPEGLILFDDKKLVGQFFHRILNREKDFAWDTNLIVDQGFSYMLATAFQTASTPALIPQWYMTLFNGSTTPANSLTAANFAATMGEISSTTEGFSNITRPLFVPNPPTALVVNNTNNYATFNCVCSTSIQATGGAVISDPTRGGTAGTLWSAALFSGARQIYNGDTFQLGYQTSLSN